MRDKEQKAAAKAFAKYWAGRGDEKSESQKFWIELLGSVFGVENPTHFITFEDRVFLGHTSFIDGYIDSTKVLIEQKKAGKDLRKGIRQSDGSFLSPFQQAQRYSAALPYSRRPRWIITCNFEEFLIYDMEKPTGEPESILLSDLPKEYYRLNFLVDTGSELLKHETEVSIKAGDIVGILYDKLITQYREPDENSLRSLNALCVRLVFCLYAEDAGIFGGHMMFHDYLKDIPAHGIRRALTELFKALDTPVEKRDKYLADDNPKLAAFPYVNGGLFADESIEVPPFTEELKDLLLNKASEGFDWSEISPTIFGAVFESTLNPETRRSGGMHYTSLENIHKVIDPLFLDDLKAELEEILDVKVDRTRKARLEAFTDKLAKFTFLDPAAGSGNFLTETYLSLRKLENRALEAIYRGQMVLDVENMIKVSIGQFYGIEINDFAVTVAKTALWIAESQMLKKTEEIVKTDLEFLPLKSYANIVEGNALRLDWETVVPKERLTFLMGNPPFIGYSLQSKEQKQDILSVYVDEKGKPYKTAGKIDYVAGWYYKAAQLMHGTNIRAALVSTNSITQGEQVAGVWKPLYEQFGVHIDFAYRTFRWDSEANMKAHVHCVIVGFSCADTSKSKMLFSVSEVKNGDTKETVIRKENAENINPYLLDAPIVFVESRKKSISNAPKIQKGSIPVDDGNLLLTDCEYRELCEKEPKAKEYVRPFLGAKEYLHGKKRWCLWLKNVAPSELKSLPEVMERIRRVKEFRETSTKAATRKYAQYPYLFMEIRQPISNYILIPSHSSEKRKYVPMGFLEPTYICGNANLLVENAGIYHFGVLMSNVHMAWMRAVCGRLEMRYRYSNDIVYNNFPWCSPTDAQREKIERTAQAVLDARALYPDSSLADLYDELTMPPELRRAHQQNDRAVMEAYGFPVKSEFTESMCVAELMRMYREMTEKKI